MAATEAGRRTGPDRGPTPRRRVAKRAIGRAGFVWLALSAALLAPPMPARAETPAEQCHRLAADPDDPSKASGAAGVADGEIEEGAVEACRSAVGENPDDPVLNYQLGRSLVEWGRPEEAVEPLRRAAEAGEAAALYLYALLLQETGSGTAEDVAAVLERSRQGGYSPAVAALEQLGGGSEAAKNASGGIDYGAFERGDILKALVEGDADFVRGLAIGIVAENFSGPAGFAKYYEGFSASLTNAYMCPALLPAGAGRIFDMQIANRTTDRTFDDVMSNPMKMLESGGALDTLLRYSQLGVTNPKALIQGQIAGETSMAMLTEQGTKDGFVLKNLGDSGDPNWGCNGIASLAIADTVRALMR